VAGASGSGAEEVSQVTLTLNDEERKIVLTTLKARLDDVQTEMTRTDNPAFNTS